MRIDRFRKITGALGVSMAGLCMMITAAAYGQPAARPPYKAMTANVVDSEGNMRMPADYRTNFQMLGTWAVAADNAPGSKEMHVVYASPGTIAAYRKGRRFPDGAILVKEVFKTATKPMTTGTVSSAGTLAGWFVMVKDDVGRFPKNKLWGDGWGWSWFDAANPKKTTSTDYKKDCPSCHIPAQKSDWVYTHGYPPLGR